MFSTRYRMTIRVPIMRGCICPSAVCSAGNATNKADQTDGKIAT